MIRVIAVDDEPLALKQLESYISKIPLFEHAVEGFRVDAVDYLLKPFSLADFMKTAERVKARWEALQVLSQPAVSTEPADDSLFFRTDYKSVRVKPEEIRYVESMSEYIKVYTDGNPNPLVVLLGLKYLIEKLPEGRFIRIHRSYIVPLDRIREVGKAEVKLEDGTVLPVGDAYRQGLKDYLDKHSF